MILLAKADYKYYCLEGLTSRCFRGWRGCKIGVKVTQVPLAAVAELVDALDLGSSVPKDV